MQSRVSSIWRWWLAKDDSTMSVMNMVMTGMMTQALLALLFVSGICRSDILYVRSGRDTVILSKKRDRKCRVGGKDDDNSSFSFSVRNNNRKVHATFAV